MNTRLWVGMLSLSALGCFPFLSCSANDAEGSAPTSGGTAGTQGNGGSGGLDGSVADRTSGDSNVAFDMGTAKDGPLFDPDAYWANDPPPPVCLDGGATAPVPGGTPDCPDDKNRQGCPCDKVGDQAPCWPGFRKNRNRGICHDGTATCELRGENQRVWSECVGFQLPTGDTGKEACQCFSAGKWKLSNTSPCFVGTQADPYSDGAVSTIFDGKTAKCPVVETEIVKPTEPWSPNTLKVDCAGHFKLCYALKAGDVANPLPSDCTYLKVCTEADYPTPNVEQKFPDLPSWLATTPENITCIKKFNATGGYGEMTVLGLSVECDEVDDGKGGELVFNRVTYCPISCNDTPDAPECKNCQVGGSGEF